MLVSDEVSASRSEGEPLWRLLFRFIWPFLYFRDVTRGSKLERQQNYRFNRAMRIYLPGFAVKWSLLTALCFGIGDFMMTHAPALFVPATCLYVTGAWTFVVAIVVLTAWTWLERFPELY